MNFCSQWGLCQSSRSFIASSTDDNGAAYLQQDALQNQAVDGGPAATKQEGEVYRGDNALITTIDFNIADAVEAIPLLLEHLSVFFKLIGQYDFKQAKEELKRQVSHLSGVLFNQRSTYLDEVFKSLDMFVTVEKHFWKCLAHGSTENTRLRVTYRNENLRMCRLQNFLCGLEREWGMLLPVLEMERQHRVQAGLPETGSGSRALTSTQAAHRAAEQPSQTPTAKKAALRISNSTRGTTSTAPSRTSSTSSAPKRRPNSALSAKHISLLQHEDITRICDSNYSLKLQRETASAIRETITWFSSAKHMFALRLDMLQLYSILLEPPVTEKDSWSAKFPAASRGMRRSNNGGSKRLKASKPKDSIRTLDNNRFIRILRMVDKIISTHKVSGDRIAPLLVTHPFMSPLAVFALKELDALRHLTLARVRLSCCEMTKVFQELHLAKQGINGLEHEIVSIHAAAATRQERVTTVGVAHTHKQVSSPSTELPSAPLSSPVDTTTGKADPRSTSTPKRDGSNNQLVAGVSPTDSENVEDSRVDMPTMLKALRQFQLNILATSTLFFHTCIQAREARFASLTQQPDQCALSRFVGGPNDFHTLISRFLNTPKLWSKSKKGDPPRIVVALVVGLDQLKEQQQYLLSELSSQWAKKKRHRRDRTSSSTSSQPETCDALRAFTCSDFLTLKAFFSRDAAMCGAIEHSRRTSDHQNLGKNATGGRTSATLTRPQLATNHEGSDEARTPLSTPMEEPQGVGRWSLMYSASSSVEDEKPVIFQHWATIVNLVMALEQHMSGQVNMNKFGCVALNSRTLAVKDDTQQVGQYVVSKLDSAVSVVVMFAADAQGKESQEHALKFVNNLYQITDWHLQADKLLSPNVAMARKKLHK